MKNQFLIANMKYGQNLSQKDYKEIDNPSFGNIIYHVDDYNGNNLTILLDGYVLPRNDIFEHYQKLSQFELIQILFMEYGIKFVKYIKGNFIIVLVHDDSIDIFTDHFGLNQCFVYQKQGCYAISNDFNLFKDAGLDLTLNREQLAVKAILHRIPGGKTQFKYILKAHSASYIKIAKGEVIINQYWSPDEFIQSTSEKSNEYIFNDFALLIKDNFCNFLKQHSPNRHAITLTGGKDSRTGLAALMANGITPAGFTYGNPNSRDAVYARMLSQRVCLEHKVFAAPDNKDYFTNFATEIISYGHPDISLHRAHRLYAFKKMAEFLNDTSAYYAGYMAGEFLMGVYYDSLVFTDFLTTFWDSSVLLPTGPKLENSFIRPGIVDVNDIGERLNELRTFDSSLNLKKRQFYGIFEIGIPHHSQDIFLASQCFDFVYPFFIDIDFLEALFQSRYNFFFTDNKTGNLLNRYKLYEFNLNIQHILYPDMDNVQFGKRGSYNTREFLRGKYYWAALKTIRYLFQRQKYPPTYVYSKNYRDFLLSHLEDLNRDKSNELHAIYDVPEAMKKLEAIGGYTNEAAMHRFTNIVQLFLQLKYYKYQN